MPTTLLYDNAAAQARESNDAHVAADMHSFQQQQQTHARRHVRLSDRRLADLADRASRSINWDVLRSSVALWDKKRIHGADGFALYTRRSREMRYIMATGSVACSLVEIRNILRAPTDEKHATTMTELYGANFVYGAVVHRASSHATANATAAAIERTLARARRTTGTSLSTASSSSLSSSAVTAAGDVLAPEAYDLLVKTATFVKPHVFARNEQWCFLDHYQPLTAADAADGRAGFVLAMSSLDPDDVFVGKTKGAPSELQGVTAAYSVVLDPVRRLVRVVFYAQLAVDDHVRTRSGGSDGHSSSEHRSSVAAAAAKRQSKRAASKSTLAKRLTQMAKATSRLPLIVRRRRLGAQVFADSKALGPSNTRCVCCAKSLQYQQLLQKRKQCHLCGYFVCERCSATQHMERSRVKLFVVRVCEHCLERVDEANYDNVPPEGMSAPAIRANAPNAPRAGEHMAALLRESLEKAPVERKRAVRKVIQYLVDEDYGSSDDACEIEPSRWTESELDPQLPHPAAATPAPAVAPVAATTTTVRRSGIRLTDETPESEYIRALETGLLRVHETPLEHLQLANSTSRKYPLTYKDGNVGVPQFPVPRDEQRRLELVRQQRLTELTNVPELEVICSLARRELDCAVGLVTVMGAEHIHILASTEDFSETRLPREDVFCAHTIMDNVPVLIPHPEADIAYSRLPVVADGGLRFYFGVPLKAADSTVVGTVCCFGPEPRDVSQAQFAAVEKLADAASRLLQARMKHGEALSSVVP